MELTIRQVPVSYLRRIWMEPVYQELTAEAVVPESLPDIDRVLDAGGTVIVQEKQCEGGELRLSGGVQATVLYMPEGESVPQTLETWLPFSIRRRVETSEGCTIETSWIKSLDARMVNARKAIVRANVGFELMQLQPEELQLAQVSDAPPMLQMQQLTYPVLLPVGCGEQSFRVQDELSLPDSVPPIDRILKWKAEPNVEESRMIGNKAVFKGDVVIEVLYLGADGSVNTFVGQLPYSQYVELNGEWPDASVAVFPAITAATVETDGQMDSRTLLADLNLLAQVCVFNELFLSLTEDAYAVGGTLAPVWQEISLQPRLDTQTRRQNAELRVPAKASQIVSASVYADRPSLRRGEDAVYATSALSGTVLYVDEDGALRSKALRGECVCEAQTHQSCKCVPACRITQSPDATRQGEEIRILVPADFTLEFYGESGWRNLAGGEITPEAQRKRPSVVIRRWQGGDLWSIAKQHAATVADIRAANGMEDDRPPAQNILLIPLR